MTNKLKKTAIAVGVAMGLGISAQAGAVGTILFDRDGTGGATGAIRLDTFNWAADNVLAQNLVSQSTLVIPGFPSPTVLTTAPSFSTDFQLSMQGVLAGFSASNFTNTGAANCTASGTGSNCGVITGSQFTFELTTHQDVTSVTPAGGTGTTLTIDPTAGGPPNPGTPNFFKIYYNATGVNTADQLLGTGYNTGTLILTGMVYDSNATFTLFQDPTKLKKLDTFGTDDRPGIGTYTGTGAAQFDITVLSQDTNFFVSDILGSTITVGMDMTSTLSDPFQQAQPAALVVGHTPFYGNDTKTGSFSGSPSQTRVMNDFTCGQNLVGGVPTTGTLSCDFQLQHTGASAFFNPQEVPVPGTVALLGMGLLGFGWFGRKGRKA